MNINIIEVFKSVQGETSLSGLPTTFIRLAACNLRCTWCDTTYSFGRGEPRTIDAIMHEVRTNGCPYVCVTGGEPLLQKNAIPLMQQLCDEGYTVSLETSGSLSTADVDPRVRVILDIKCPGSGMSHKNLWENIPLIKKGDEVKFVLLDRADYEWAKEICAKYSLFDKPCEVLLSPVFGSLEAKDLVNWLLEDKLKVRLNMQVHKFIWDPATKGV